MRYIVILFCLISISINAQTVTQPGFRDYQLSGATLPDSILYIMGTDTLDGSAKQGLGKWYRGSELQSLWRDTDWLRYRTMTTPSNTDTMYHTSGPVIIGADTVILAGANGFGKAALNVGGVLDVRYPDYEGTNIVVGAGSLAAGGSSTNNFVMGQGVMPSATTADYNIAIGNNAMYTTSTGDFNVAIGPDALLTATGSSAQSNVSIGYRSAYSGNVTAQNVILGAQAASGGCTSFNTILGYQAGFSTPISSNVFIGYQSGRLNTGSGNIFIGKESGENETGSNLLYIDNSNGIPLIGGDFAADTLRVNGDLSIRDAVSGASTDSVMVWTPSNGRVKMRNASAFGGATNLSIAQSGGTQVIQSSTGTDVGVRNLYGLLISEGATDTLHFRVDSSKIATQYDITQIPINSIKNATATNTANHTNYAQEWTWNTLAGATGLKLSSTSTAAASNLHKLFEISTTGANGTSGQSTYGGYFSNTHSGTTSTNYGLYSVATGAASANYGVYGTSNSSGLTGNVGAGVSGRNSNGGIAVEGITTSGGVGVYADSPDGYSIYSTTINGTAGAFRHNWSGNTDYGAQLDIIRNTSNGSNGAAGIGGGINFMAETSTGATSTTNQIKSIWTTATNASRTSSMIFTGVNSATEGDILTLKGSKQLQFHGYGTGGTFTASPVADLFVDATGNVVQGSMTGQSWTADADDATTPVVVSNQTLAFRGNRGIVTDLIDGVVDSISFVIDGDEFIDVTTPEADDWVLLHDENGASADKLEKILWSDLASLVGGTDTHFGADNLTWTANRTHDQSTYTTTIQGSNMYWKFEDTDATAGPSLTLEGNVGNSDAPFGTIQFQYSDSGFATDQAAWTLKANRETNDQEHSTLEITANEASAAPPVVVFEENQNLSDNTQETFIQLNGGIAKTQYWESATSNAITLDRGYYNVALLTGHTGTITLPEIYGINEANTEVSATLVPIGQEYVITNLSGSAVTIAALNNTGTANDDWLNNTEAGTYSLANGNSIIVKATTIVSNEGHWFIY